MKSSRASCKVAVAFVRFKTVKFFRHFSRKKFAKVNFHENRTAGADFFQIGQAEGRTDGRT